MDVYAPADNPLEVEDARAFAIVLAISALVLLVVSTLLCLVALVLRFRRSQGEERQQLKWFAYASTLTVVSLLLALIPPLYAAGSALQIVAIPLLPVATGIAVLRYRLYDIDVIINRTLVYGALTACVTGLYALAVGGLGALLWQARGNLLISLLAAGMVAVLFAPLKERLQRGVNRLMYGERDDPYKVLSRLGERLDGTLVPEAVLPTVVRTVREALKLPYVAIALREGGGSVIAAESGTSTNQPLRLPLVHQGETVGELLLAPRAPGEGLAPTDRRLLDDLARQAGVAVHAVRLTNDLQRSRERLVTAREERRRLRRDLHDGLGPSLGSLPLKLDVAGDLVDRDPATARALIRGLKEQAQSAVTDIRRLVYALRPPALDDLGLIGAIGESAAQYAQNGLRVSVEAPQELPPLPAAVEVAAYRIAQEAMTNVVRHAAARQCSVSLALDEEAGGLHLEIRDDGRGLSSERGRGVGIASMRERAEELGGSCVVESPPEGGTRVRATLPCTTPADTVESEE